MSAEEETKEEAMSKEVRADEEPLMADEEAAQVDEEPSTGDAGHPARQWLQTRDAAEALGIEKTTLRLWAAAGKLETRPCDPTRAYGPKALEYRVPPGAPIPVPGPQAQASKGTAYKLPARAEVVQPPEHPAYQWTRGSRQMAEVLGLNPATVIVWADSGKLETRQCETDRRALEYRVTPGAPVPAPMPTGGRARKLGEQQQQASALPPDGREHLITDLCDQVRERDGVILELRAKIEEREAQLRALAAAERADAMYQAWREAQSLERHLRGDEPVTLRALLETATRWCGAEVIGLDLRLETGARVGVAP